MEATESMAASNPKPIRDRLPLVKPATTAVAPARPFRTMLRTESSTARRRSRSRSIM